MVRAFATPTWSRQPDRANLMLIIDFSQIALLLPTSMFG